MDPGRLERQIGEHLRYLSGAPVRKLTYPRSFERLPEVRDAILTDSPIAAEVLA